MDKEERMKVIRARRPLKRGREANYHHGDWEARQRETLARAERYKALMLAGGTLGTIAKAEGLSRERIRQVLLVIGFQSAKSPERKVWRAERRAASRARRTFTGECAHHRCKKQFTNIYAVKIPANPTCSYRCWGALRSTFPPEIMDVYFSLRGKERIRYKNRVRTNMWVEKHRHDPAYKAKVALSNKKQAIRRGDYKPKERLQCPNFYKHHVAQYFQGIKGGIQKFCTVSCREHYWKHDPIRREKIRGYLRQGYQNRKARNATQN